jgi:dTDP-4-amino-4,6-dideoxygalactose transaminase
MNQNLRSESAPIAFIDVGAQRRRLGSAIPVSDQFAEEVISLPMHACLDEPSQKRVIETVRAAPRP